MNNRTDPDAKGSLQSMWDEIRSKTYKKCNSGLFELGARVLQC